jgi:hypothetical protein
MLDTIRTQAVSFAVDFFSASEPFVMQTWRPREEDSDECDFAEACRRVRSLCRSMDARENVDGLIPSSVCLRDAVTGETLFVRLADGSTDIVDGTNKDQRARLALVAMIAAFHASPDVARALDEAARGMSGADA